MWYLVTCANAPVLVSSEKEACIAYAEANAPAWVIALTGATLVHTAATAKWT